jgi:hypothetical protein
MKRSSAAYGERYEENGIPEKLWLRNTAMGGGSEWRKIDASRDVEAIHKELEDIVTETMGYGSTL